MLERLLVQEPAVCASIISSSRRDDRSLSFSDNYISYMRDLVSVLSSFKQVTTRLSAETVSTASLILPTLLKLLNVILQEHDDDNNFTKEVKSAIKNDLASRYQEDHVRKFLQISAFIDPQFKHLSFLEASKIEETIKLIHTECMSVASRRVVPVKHETPCKEKTLPTDTEPNPQPIQSLEQSAEQLLPKKIKLEETELTDDDFFADIVITKVEKKEVPLHQQISNEIERYREEQVFTKDPLHWWKNNSFKYTYLSRVAKRLLCVPASSVPSERIFSLAVIVLAMQRANLAPENVDKILFLNKNM